MDVDSGAATHWGLGLVVLTPGEGPTGLWCLVTHPAFRGDVICVPCPVGRKRSWRAGGFGGSLSEPEGPGRVGRSPLWPFVTLKFSDS